MRDRFLKRCLLLMLAAVLLMSAACGETVRGDLSERFGDQVSMEVDGVKYRLRNRMTTILLMGVQEDEALGGPAADFVALVAVDDAQKRVTPIRIDGNTLVSLPELSAQLRLRELYAMDGEGVERCERMVRAVNALLGDELIDSYFAFDVRGAAVIEGYVGVEGGAEAQLRALKAELETRPMSEFNQYYALLSDYITTDMKSGAAMKAADKARRYELLHSLVLPTLPVAEEEALPALEADGDAIRALVVEVFFEQSIW